MRDLDECCPGYDKAAALPDPFGWTERHLFRSEGVPIAEIPRWVKGVWRCAAKSGLASADMTSEKPATVVATIAPSLSGPIWTKSNTSSPEECLYGTP